MKKQIMTVFAGMALLITASFAQADTFVGSDSGIFVDPTPTTAIYSGTGTDTLTTGVALAGYDETTISYTGGSFSGDLNDSFVLGQLYYWNGVTEDGTSLTSVSLTITFDFTQPADLTLADDTMTFTLVFDLTPNTDPVLNSDVNDDILTFNQSSSDLVVYTGGQTYLLTFLGFSPSASSLDNVVSVHENQGALFKLYASVSTVDTPEPATMALFGLGLVGLAGFVRRKK